MPFVYTIGYGNLSVKKFDQKLCDRLSLHNVYVIDIRRPGCKSWNGTSGYGFRNIGFHLLQYGINYIEAPCFQNRFDELVEYEKWIKSKEAKTHVKR